MDVILLYKNNCRWIKSITDSLFMKGSNTRVHIISNDNIPYKQDRLFTYKLKDYATPILNRLDRIYIHKNTCSREFNLFNIKRWFYILEFVKRNNITNFMCTDWDVVFFCDIDKEGKRFKRYDFTVNNKISLGLSFWNNTIALQDFVRFILRVYSNQKSTEAIRVLSHYENRRKAKKPGGVCDMTFAGRFASDSGYKTIDTYDIHDNSIFDNNIKIVDGWQADKMSGLKNIFFENGNAYCFNTKSKTNVRFNCTHLFGGYKSRIPGIFNRYKESLK